ncbi:hypothetical protein SERLA73DRAFT_190389 [Serpula lacrymans var. lacrymans S7.3]|uniref:RING-type domain-containing protein n=2 Tax=Serpula lacrymans var. lacrymans TaxID=341189 RepID=F8QFK9_SERL3|nr:uncharacterized protein SERLADRAFT_457742 [Serpula lacrymans var. lacrymans S7.9]EGN92843.1 hypothetical protein SERLA73DRAFT_190389 [Serpula lacrymans var. lacrymans S7.3]EGO29673.1 hypothetical protein SERLADRAFT_457742 [Serpula lacrymans var. lacrymans S7.9]
MSNGRGLPLLSGPPPSYTGDLGSSCRRCSKDFNVIFSRAKRCNHCGYSYCSSCSDFQALMPRPGPLSGISGYDTASVCAYCIEFLTITASGKTHLKSMPLAKLKKYVDVYNIKVNGAIEKQDLIDSIIAVRTAYGCLPFANEDYYRKHSVPNQGSPGRRGIFSRLAPDPPLRPSAQPRAQSSRPAFARPDLDPNHRPTTSYTPRPQSQSQTRPQTQYRPYTSSSRSGSTSHRSTSSQASPNLGVPPQHARTRTTSAPPTPTPTPLVPVPVPTLDELLDMMPYQIAALSIGTLKGILSDNHVNARLILEKSDLVAKVSTLVEDERQERERKRREEEEEEQQQRWAREDAENERQRQEAAAAERARRQARVSPDIDEMNVDGSTTAEAGHQIQSSDEDTNRAKSPAPPMTPPKAQPLVERHGLCTICQDEEANIAIVDCGHLAMCRACSELVMSSTRECPLCRTRIVTSARLLRIYRT